MFKLIVPGMALWLCAISTAGAGSSGDFSVLSKPLPPVKSPSRVGTGAANPCASFGPNFRRIEGTDTCVKIGGAVSVEAGSGFGR
ncbi:hypothetical protein [Bradyrhizobium sp. STM 3557]|uniref:hypothetical protein n=1 Tax=Bradyrhizobium sp. STM 3557 TaxID=578920 RepID=UPI00388D9297